MPTWTARLFRQTYFVFGFLATGVVDEALLASLFLFSPPFPPLRSHFLDEFACLGIRGIVKAFPHFPRVSS
jgi:hypothetical protein